MTIEQRKILDGFGIVDQFCETIGRIEQIGPCRRLTFVTRSSAVPDSFDVVARVVLSAEALQDLAQMAAADSPVPLAFNTLSTDQRAN